MYITEPRFGVPDYRKPIVWFDKMLVIFGFLASIIGQILCTIWAFKFAIGDMATIQPLSLLVVGILLWLPGSYFRCTGNRGLIYHHMDFLVQYLEDLIENRRQPAHAGDGE